ncbi:MAG: hypothetical protein LBJ59_05845 [Zoogloeaceae bacterium]|jgi:hypothetical protein|nr:hypothetical protein [Zoogloeaceae bacterium]
MNDYSEDEAYRIYCDALLASFGFLARIVTALPPFPALLMERESIMATAGSRFFPTFCRAASRKAFMALIQRPSRRQRRKHP